MTDHAAMIDKLERSAASERACGNHEAAAAFDARAEKLRQKYNLAPPVVKPAEAPVMQPQKQRDYFSDFPGVAPREAPLTNAQLSALRTEAAKLGRMLSDNDRARVLGQKVEDAPPERVSTDRYFEV